MKRNLNKIGAVLAFVIGSMAIVAGSRVLVGIDPGYHVINWVPLYNYSMGIVTVMITTALLWKNSRWAVIASMATFGAHATVMAVLQTAYKGSVAPESIQAMTIRLAAWMIILGLMYARVRMVEAKPQPQLS